jgi:hypothetical protein
MIVELKVTENGQQEMVCKQMWNILKHYPSIAFGRLRKSRKASSRIGDRSNSSRTRSNSHTFSTAMLGVTEVKAKNLVNLGSAGFLDFAHRPEFYILENTTFRELDLFPSSGEGKEISIFRVL